MLQTYWPEFATLALIHFLAVIAPGPDFAVTIRQSVRLGRQAARQIILNLMLDALDGLSAGETLPLPIRVGLMLAAIPIAYASQRWLEDPIRTPFDVDKAWHAFLLHTREYAEFCHQIAGRFIHHVPTDEPSSPPAPGRLSTMICWPTCFVSSVATMRASVSDELPGACGTINRIGRSG